MSAGFTERMFSYLSYLFFEEISPKFRADLFKNLMDIIYIVFEKACYQFDGIIDMYFHMYDELIDNEIQLANISKDDNILVIGCGALPATSVLLAQKTGSHIIGIDKDKESVKRANMISLKLQLDNILTFQYVKDVSVDLEQYSLIFVVYGVKGESKVFQLLSKQMNENARIIYRISNDQDSYESLKNIDVSSNFEIVKDICTPSMGLTKSLLLKKK